MRIKMNLTDTLKISPHYFCNKCKAAATKEKRQKTLFRDERVRPAGIYKPGKITICFNLKIIWLHNFLEWVLFRFSGGYLKFPLSIMVFILGLSLTKNTTL